MTGSAEQLEAAEKEQRLQRHMWALAGEALDQEPLASAPRLWVEALGLLGRGLIGVLIAAAVVASLLVLSADLDRPTRGPIQVSDAPLTE